MTAHNGFMDARKARPVECAHKPPRSTVGALGMLDTCKCGAVRFVLRQKGNDGSNRPGLRWDRWS